MKNKLIYVIIFLFVILIGITIYKYKVYDKNENKHYFIPMMPSNIRLPRVKVTSDVKEEEKDNTVDENIRYYGSNPNNYVSFNNELWRIIGVFGNNVKLVRKDILGSLSWDSSEESVNAGAGINQWGESTYEDGSTYEGADLQVYLNKMYYGGETVTCYGSFYNKTKTCPTGTIDETSKSFIDNHSWNTGAIKIAESTDTLLFYQAERGMVSGKSSCSDGDNCNDTVERTTTWTGYVGLPYITDYAYASSENDCNTKIDVSSAFTYKCKNNNWMHYGSTPNDATRMLSPYANPARASDVWNVYGSGDASSSFASNTVSAFPTIYLKSNILIESGNGTSSNPYILKLSN